MNLRRLISKLSFSAFRSLRSDLRSVYDGKALSLSRFQVNAKWEQRTRIAASSPDNQKIARVPEAGNINGPWITMHNGLQVLGLGYYGRGMAHLLYGNRGVHEPQQECVFQEVLRSLSPNATMMELGAYWGFYSLWFLKCVPGGRAYLVEPAARNLKVGKKNFEQNGCHGVFLRGLIGGKSSVGNKEVRTYTVDELISKYRIKFLDVLHADIQGNERIMFDGARELFMRKQVGYVFISTHSNWLHSECLAFLKERDFLIIASADLDQSYSVDGLIVARGRWYEGIDAVQISLRQNCS